MGCSFSAPQYYFVFARGDDNIVDYTGRMGIDEIGFCYNCADQAEAGR
jgi:hypothetical protein